jgi:hypothetical protein
MKKLTIIFAILLVTQISQAQMRVNTKLRNMPHQNELMKGSCGAATGIFVDEINSNSATIHWTTNGAKQFVVQYVNINDPKDKGMLITPFGSVALDNLTPCATYKFVILAKCVDGNYKSKPQMFVTLGCK